MALRQTSQRVLWLTPVAVAALAAVAAAWSALERDRVREELDRMYRVHVESVSRLIQEGARQAADSIDLIYALSEQSLMSAAERVSRLDPNRVEYPEQIKAAGLEVWVVTDRAGGYAGQWGPTPEPDREALVDHMRAAEPGEIVQSARLRELNLYCARLDLEENTAIACKSAGELVRMRRETGIGPLLREVAKQGVIYAAIQDPSGVLASSPGAELSSWSDDPELGRALEGKTGALVFRLIGVSRRPDSDGGDSAAAGNQARGAFFEGMRRLALPDGSFAVLRIGVDAAYLLKAQDEIERRHRLLLVSIGLVLVLSLAGTWVLTRWDKRRRLAEEQLAAREQESHWWKTTAQMAATVAHEIRNPLNTVKMAAQRLSAEFQVPRESQADYAELVGLLVSEADRVDRVVAEFVELGRPIELKMETVPCEEAVNEAVIPLRLRAEQEGKRLVVQAPAGDLVHLDRLRFSQIVRNLVNNALDAVNRAGTVKVTAACQADGLYLVIEDDGIGMTAEQLQQARLPFVTTKARGTGLGLPLAIRLAEAHEGALTLASAPGHGTQARLFIPGREKNAGN